MGRLYKYFLFIICISYVLICCLLLFSRGFLLSRNVILSKSICSVDPDLSSCQDNYVIAPKIPSDNIFSQNCLCTNTKVIIIVIDALRYDFVAEYVGSNKNIYHNKLPFIHRLMSNRNHTRLYKFIADPPTTTMQRLHGMMTGSLPTFIDIGSNFASSEIIEDNLLSQLNNYNKKTVFLGDDTWIGLFPNHFHRSFSYPSFNVWDLDTVDTGVSLNILSEIGKPDWDLLIAHYLGVDHCGHRYGPNHPEMGRKLTEMNKVIENVVSSMDNNTVLFVFGDHGMTEHGDHGGASDEETTSAIFVYSPINLNICEDTLTKSIMQIDLLPTLSTILGVPIPFSNLGSLVIEFLPTNLFSLKNYSFQHYIFESMENNIDQITNYIKEYNSFKNYFPPEHIETIMKKFNTLSPLKLTKNNRFFAEAKSYLASVQNMCRSFWTQFDFNSINISLILFSIFLSTLFGMNSQSLNVEHLEIRLYFIIYFSFLSLLAGFYNFVNIPEKELFFYVSSVLGTIFFIASSFALWFLSLGNFFHSYSIFNLFSLFVHIFSNIGLLSNSYIITESSVVTFFLLTMVLWTFSQVFVTNRHMVLESKISSLHLKALTTILTMCLCLIIRSLSYFWQCYDAESINCQINKVSTFLSSLCSIITVLLFYKCLDLFCCFLGNPLQSIFFKFFEPLCIILCSSFWLINNYFSFNGIRSLDCVINIIPQAVCLLSFIGIIYLFIKPLAAFTQPNKALEGMESSLFIHNINFVNRVSGIYLSVFFVFTMLLLTLSYVILNEKRVPSSVFMFASIGILTILLGFRKVLGVKNQSELFEVPLWDVVVWHLSSLVHFYGTGHQPTFPSLQWDAMGPFTQHLPIFIPGFLMILNTFLSQIVHSLFLPLLLIVPFTIKNLLKSEFNNSIFLLASKTHNRRQSLFSLFIKMVLLQGCRVLTIMLSATIHSRHLMVWKIFAPKFIFESVGLIVSLPFLLIGFAFVERISSYIYN